MIVQEVLCKMNPTHLNVAKHPIGIDYHVKEMKVLLKLGTSDVRIVGIYGMGEIGKTTLLSTTKYVLHLKGVVFFQTLQKVQKSPMV
jgi:hypothetical protein